MRILGLDIGDKKVGVALSDPMGLTAQGIKVFINKGSKGEIINRINELVREHEVEKIVVGLPKNMDGSTGPQAEKVRTFAGKLAGSLGIPVVLWDERLTTSQAERMLIKADLSRARRKQVIDKIAAALILQSYLEFNASRNRMKEGNGLDSRDVP